MNRNEEKILSFESLLIGFASGRHKNILLPPLNAIAVKGELIALIGQNGVGKSTLLRTITGLQQSLGGEIFISGKNINDYSRISLAKNIGYISTETVKVSNMKVLDLVSLGRYPYTNWLGKIGNEDHDIILDSIEKVGMVKYCNRFINELSDGERQRAMIARVLAQDTNIIVMDEPTAFLDIRSKFEIVHLMHDLSRSKGKTVIFSTHDLHTAISESDKIWLTLADSFKEGAPEDLILEGSFDRLFNDSRVKFSSADGSFTFRSDLKRKIFVSATGIEKYWTEKAVNRAGYEITNGQANTEISVIHASSGTRWIVSTDKINVEFSTIYELVKWLNSQNE
jgi:iron complex transport system ATP-binding protein